MTSPAFQPSLFGLQAAIGDTIPITAGNAYLPDNERDGRTPPAAVILSETGVPGDKSSSLGSKAKDLRLGSEPTPGICRHCLCTGDSCKTASGDHCDWLDETHTCCNAEACRNKQARVVVKPLPTSASIVRKPSPKSRFRPARRTSMRVAVDRWLTR
jgi:hypothetical protein